MIWPRRPNLRRKCQVVPDSWTRTWPRHWNPMQVVAFKVEPKKLDPRPQWLIQLQSNSWIEIWLLNWETTPIPRMGSNLYTLIRDLTTNEITTYQSRTRLCLLTPNLGLNFQIKTWSQLPILDLTPKPWIKSNTWLGNRHLS